MPRRWMCSAAAVLLMLAGNALAAAPEPVQTAQGLVQGHASGQTLRYLGIPYAAPPTGELRWRPPAAPAPWSGVRQASRFGHACAQIGGYFASDDPDTFDQPYGQEDCLYLNVWTPQSHSAAPRPVLVFIHGGGGITGAASLPLYEATRLADALGAVVVSLNYRLGVFGGLHVPELASGDPVADSGSYALLDQIAALRWVQRNIGAFGGDPGNVTVAGHSAGGVSVWALMRSPLATGLFQRSVVLSGAPLQSTPDEAAERSDVFLSQVLRQQGLLDDGDDLADYRRSPQAESLESVLYGLSTAEVLEASRDLKATPTMLDGVVLPVAAGDKDHVPVNAVPTIIGSVRNEASLFLIKRYGRVDELGFWSLINSEREDLRRADFFSLFSYWRYRTAVFFGNRVLHGMVDRSADLLSAAGVPVYCYSFEWAQMPQPWAKLFGAYHGIDIPFLFGNFQTTPNFSRFTWRAETQDAREILSAQMMRSIQGFVESGDPNRYPGGLQWQRWDTAQQATVIQ